MGAPFGATGSEAFAVVAAGGAGAALVAAAAADVVDGACFGARSNRPAATVVAVGRADGVMLGAVAVAVAATGTGSAVGVDTAGGGGEDGVVGAADVAGDVVVVSVTVSVGFAARTRTTAATAATAIDTTTPAARPFANERGRSVGRTRSDP